MSAASLARIALALGFGVSAMAIFSQPAAAKDAAMAPKEAAAAPKPARLPDGHPNWTGFWSAKGGLLDHDIGLGGSAELPPGVKPGPPPIPFADFPALKSPYRERLAGFMVKMMKEGSAPDPVAQCFPPGMPRMMSMVYGMELLQTKGQVAITSEWQAASRRIWLDRKDHPPADELDPSYVGDSVGHWEGDVLVVDTVGIRDDVPLNYSGLMHSTKLHMVERFSQTAPGILVDDFTMDDPDVFSGVWHHRETYRYRPDLRIKEYVCLDNNRNVGSDGAQDFSKDPSRK